MSEFNIRTLRSHVLKGALLGLAYYGFDGLGAYFAIPELLDPVSYTHLTLPTNREV